MTLIAFALIFASVFMHAAWNFLSKKVNPSPAFYCLAAAVGGIFWLPAAFFSQVPLGELPWKFWGVFLISNFFEVLYFVALARGYRRGDISLVYPLGRALPVIMVAVVTTLCGIGRQPSPMALAGMAVIFFGVLVMPLPSWRDFKLRTYCTKVLFWVVMIGVGTTGYTIFDSMAMKMLEEVPGRSGLYRSIMYLCLVQTGITVTMAGPVLCRKSQREELRKLLGSFSPYLTGIFSASAYILVLRAMNFVTNVSYLQAFRQMSLPLGVLAGIFILREPCPMPKAVGILLVVSGLVMTAF